MTKVDGLKDRTVKGFQVSETRSRVYSDGILPPALQTGSSWSLLEEKEGVQSPPYFIGRDIEDPRDKEGFLKT